MKRLALLLLHTKLMSTSLFKTSFFNLFRIWLIGGLVVMRLSLLFAVILTSGIRGKKFFRAIIYMPNIVSAVALATMWLQYVYSPRYGLLKDFFTALHLDNLAKIQFLDNEHKFWALLFGRSVNSCCLIIFGTDTLNTAEPDQHMVDSYQINRSTDKDGG